MVDSIRLDAPRTDARTYVLTAGARASLGLEPDPAAPRTDVADSVPSIESIKTKAHERLRNAWREPPAARVDADDDGDETPTRFEAGDRLPTMAELKAKSDAKLRNMHRGGSR